MLHPCPQRAEAGGWRYCQAFYQPRRAGRRAAAPRSWHGAAGRRNRPPPALLPGAAGAAISLGVNGSMQPAAAASYVYAASENVNQPANRCRAVNCEHELSACHGPVRFWVAVVRADTQFKSSIAHRALQAPSSVHAALAKTRGRARPKQPCSALSASVTVWWVPSVQIIPSSWPRGATSAAWSRTPGTCTSCGC